MTTTIEFITALFCQVDDQLAGLPKHPEAHLWPSEVVILGLLHALKGGGNRPICAYLPLFPRTPRLLHAAFGRLSGRAQARCSSQVRTVDS
jgi:hypothetical protein